MRGFRLKALTAAVAVVGAGLAYLLPAHAASDVQVTALDCELHPRKIAIQNKGDTAQNLTGWKLLSDVPTEEFDLGVAGSVGSGETFYVFNGHLSPPTPEQVGGQWIYPWNYTPTLDETAFVLSPNKGDFIRLVDASQFPWREVSALACESTTQIPALQQPATPTPAPASPDSGTGGGGSPSAGGGGDTSQAASAQTDATQSTGASQNSAASGNATAGRSSTGTTAQVANASGQAAGGPASGVGVLSAESGAWVAGPLLPVGVLSIGISAVLALFGLRTIGHGLRRR